MVGLRLRVVRCSMVDWHCTVDHRLVVGSTMVGHTMHSMVHSGDMVSSMVDRGNTIGRSSMVFWCNTIDRGSMMYWCNTIGRASMVYWCHTIGRDSMVYKWLYCVSLLGI